MRDVSRREALRLGALGVCGMVSLPIVSGCGTLSASGVGTVSSIRLARFDPSRPAGRPTGLPRRVAWANTNDYEIFVALGMGMRAAARDTGLEYLTAVAADDPATNIDQIETFLARGVGALAIQPLDEAAQRPLMRRAIGKGVCVQGIITYPSTMQVAASQYRIGYTQGKAAADYARARLGGSAEVLYFRSDFNAQLQLRRRAVLDGLRTAGAGVRVVSDVAPAGSGSVIEGGFATMTSVIEAHPKIKIVLGPDGAVVGAYRALEQAGKLTEDMYLSGVDGDSNALALVKEDGPYRASLAFAWTLMGYGMGRFAADWIDGRQIPRIMVANSIVLDSPARVGAYLAANADPASVFADRGWYEQYLPLLGNVSYPTRGTVWRQEYVPR